MVVNGNIHLIQVFNCFIVSSYFIISKTDDKKKKHLHWIPISDHHQHQDLFFCESGNLFIKNH